MTDTCMIQIGSGWGLLLLGLAVVGIMVIVVACGASIDVFRHRGLRPLAFHHVDGEWQADAADGRSFRQLQHGNWYTFPGGEFAKLNDILDHDLAQHKRVARWLGEHIPPELPEAPRNWAD